MKYTPTWDLTTIPDEPFSSEHGRRIAARRYSPITRENLKPCSKCGLDLNTRQRRKPCPTCKTRNDDRKKGKP